MSLPNSRSRAALLKHLEASEKAMPNKTDELRNFGVTFEAKCYVR
jgi:hypothetical protein